MEGDLAKKRSRSRRPFVGIERDTFTVAKGAKSLTINGTPARIPVGSNTPWFTITDDLPQHEKL
jgi:hypothetical protein